MANPVNPKTLTIRHSGLNTDGTAIEGFKGFEVEVNGEAFLTLPATLNPSGVYTADIVDEVTTLPNGVGYKLKARTFCNTGGENIYSDYSADVLFDVNIARVPSAPFGVALS